jgi:hypothetical protein
LPNIQAPNGRPTAALANGETEHAFTGLWFAHSRRYVGDHPAGTDVHGTGRHARPDRRISQAIETTLLHLAAGYTTIRSVPDLVIMLLLFFSLQIWLNNFTEWLDTEQIDINNLLLPGC